MCLVLQIAPAGGSAEGFFGRPPGSQCVRLTAALPPVGRSGCGCVAEACSALLWVGNLRMRLCPAERVPRSNPRGRLSAWPRDRAFGDGVSHNLRFALPGSLLQPAAGRQGTACAVCSVGEV